MMYRNQIWALMLLAVLSAHIFGAMPPTENLRLWLRADAGVTVGNDGTENEMRQIESYLTDRYKNNTPVSVLHPDLSAYQIPAKTHLIKAYTLQGALIASQRSPVLRLKSSNAIAPGTYIIRSQNSDKSTNVR